MLSKYLEKSIRIVLSFVLLVSGVLKGLDPFGFSLKIREFSEWFDVGFNNDFYIICAVLICAIEISLGCLLAFQIYKKQTSYITSFIFVVFTFIVFLLVVDKRHEIDNCGCFGANIVFSPFSSFMKNILLSVLSFIYLTIIKRYGEELVVKKANNKCFFILCFSFSVPFFSALFYPVIDFSPYKKGDILNETKQIKLYNDDFKEISNSIVGGNRRVCIISSLTSIPFSGITSKVVKEIEVNNKVDLYLLTTPSNAISFSNIKRVYSDENTIRSLFRTQKGVLVIHNNRIEGKWRFVPLLFPCWIKNLDLYESIKVVERYIFVIGVLLSLLFFIKNLNL